MFEAFSSKVDSRIESLSHQYSALSAEVVALQEPAFTGFEGPSVSAERVRRLRASQSLRCPFRRRSVTPSSSSASEGEEEVSDLPLRPIPAVGSV